MGPSLAEFWQQAIVNSQQAVFVVDRERSVAAVSHAFAWRLNLEPGDIIGSPCTSVMHHDGAAPPECPLRALLLDGQSHHADVSCEALGGDFFVTVTPLPDADGKLAGAIHTAYDTTTRRQFADRLRESEVRYRTVVENAPAGMFQSLPEGKLVYVNPAFATIFGYASPAEMIGIVNRTGIAEAIYEDPRKMSLLVKKARSADGGWTNHENRYRRKDGGIFDGLLHLCERRDLDSGTTYLFGFVEDVTKQRRAAAALLKSAKRSKAVLAGALAALGATVEMRDPYTAGHERRVAELACLVAKRLGWASKDIETLRSAALVHDIGKIAIPAEILSKPGRLTAIEFEMVKGHSQAGYAILAPVAFEDRVADIVVQHHERLDGSGYPLGLRGEEILPGARVLAVADVAEAMASHRPYRAALPISKVIAEISSGAGTRYDAAAAATCLQLLKHGFTFCDAA
jgi:PAS domain S-box-containing protein/putative nucleotidyltransferase with HDIG domain